MKPMNVDGRPARFRWLPPGLRPGCAMSVRQERVFLLVGVAAMFAGYDMTVFGMAMPQIQAALGIPENMVGLTVSLFRLGALAALPLVWSADIIGRRRLLLITIFGQAVCTLATGFVQTSEQFLCCQILTRIFGYAEEMLCFVVVAEEVAASARGWAAGTLSTLDYVGAGLATLLFAVIAYVPFGWRFLYIVGSLPIFLVAFLRRSLPETRRFESQSAGQAQPLRVAAVHQTLRRVATEYPRRLAGLLAGVAAFGFALWPAMVLGPKYLQTELHFTPPETTMLVVCGGLVAAASNICAGRISDRIGRRTVTIAATMLATVSYGVFYCGIRDTAVALMWVPGFFGFLCADALFSGLSAELFPTSCRATMSGLRYFVGIVAGAISLGLEGVLYDRLGGHGPAILAMLFAAPLAVLALLWLPEPAGRTLEDISAPE